jgi:hypothetical protein
LLDLLILRSFAFWVVIFLFPLCTCHRWCYACVDFMISSLKSRVLFFIIFAMKQLTEVLYLKKILVLCYRRFFFFFWWNVESNIKVAKIFLFMLGRYSGRGLFFLMLKFYLPRS